MEERVRQIKVVINQKGNLDGSNQGMKSLSSIAKSVSANDHVDAIESTLQAAVQSRTCKQFALVLPTRALGPTSFNSLRRAFRKSQDSRPTTALQHFGFV